MPIRFSCPQCAKQLAVPDDSAGKKAKCPQCQSVIAIPADPSAVAPPPLASSTPPATSMPPVPPKAPPAGAGFGTGYQATDNPFSAPAPGIPHSKKIGQIVPTAVEAGPVIEYAWDVWKRNLGLLLGITIGVFGINFGIGFVSEIIVQVLVAQQQVEIALTVNILFSLLSNALQIFLGIGQTQIVLKLLRGQHAEFGELFGGGPLFLRTLGASIVGGLAILLGFVALIIPGIILVILFWPYYHLIVDNKAKAMESFSLAYPIGKLNAGTTILLSLTSIAIMIVGVLALCVGVLAAAPLVSTLWGAAYLMMTGQIPARTRQQQ